MDESDLSVESVDEFFDDFSGWIITDHELEELLVNARKTSDVQLRRLLKQNQYFRWLIRNLVERKEANLEIQSLIELMRNALRSARE